MSSNRKNNLIIGVLGGMGTYATIHLFEQYAEIFPAQKEWDRPRIIIDNRCTMPSRVKAFLYDENKNQLIEEMAESLQLLSNAGCNKIILACNTSHLFLPAIFHQCPSLKNKIVNIIDLCASSIMEEKISNVHLLASEGTIESQIYQKTLSSAGIQCTTPNVEQYDTIRLCIEAVKQNSYDSKVEKAFTELVDKHDCCILGCTELPILYKKYRNSIKKCKIIYDPLLLALNKLRKEYYYD